MSAGSITNTKTDGNEQKEGKKKKVKKKKI